MILRFSKIEINSDFVLGLLKNEDGPGCIPGHLQWKKYYDVVGIVKIKNNTNNCACQYSFALIILHFNMVQRVADRSAWWLIWQLGEFVGQIEIDIW